MIMCGGAYLVDARALHGVNRSRIAHGYGNALATLGVSYVFNLVIDIVLEWHLGSVAQGQDDSYHGSSLEERLQALCQ